MLHFHTHNQNEIPLFFFKIKYSIFYFIHQKQNVLKKVFCFKYYIDTNKNIIANKTKLN